MRAVLLWLLLAVPVITANAHPLHLSTSEAHFNRDTGRLEVALRCFPDDLETALSRDAGRTVNITKPEEIAPAALAYLRSTWRVKDARGNPQTLAWGGIDITESHIFLFFEVPLAEGIVGARFENTFMHEIFSDQLNSVQLREGAFKTTLVFARGDGEKSVKIAR